MDKKKIGIVCAVVVVLFLFLGFVWPGFLNGKPAATTAAAKVAEVVDEVKAETEKAVEEAKTEVENAVEEVKTEVENATTGTEEAK